MTIDNFRLDGEEYYEFVDEFMAAIHLRWPKALIQHEDFQTKHAVNLLKRYRSNYLMFNDDIQGTAATTLAGIYGALKVQGLPPSGLKDLKVNFTKKILKQVFFCIIMLIFVDP